MKAANSYASLLRGVSQQVPQDRAEGQHEEQVNLLSDPVNGLTRRHGSIWQAERLYPAMAPASLSAYLSDTENYRSHDFDTQGNEYTVLYRTKPRPLGAADMPAFIVYNKTTRQFLNVVRNTSDADLDLLESGGVSALTSVGRYLFMAGNTVAVSGTSTERWDTTTNLQNSVVWVRGGAFSRKFRVTATRLDNVRVTVEYTTPASSYPEPLDTSDIRPSLGDPAGGTSNVSEVLTSKGSLTPRIELTQWEWSPSAVVMNTFAGAAMTNVHPAGPANSLQYSWAPGGRYVNVFTTNTQYRVGYTVNKTIPNPIYTSQVNDRVNAYNAAVTQWIGTSTAAVQPDAIAEQLRTLLAASGVLATREGSHITMTNVKSVEVDDSGDGELIRGVADIVNSIDKVSVIHQVGKVVKVRSRDRTEAFYLKAEAKDRSVTSGWTEVTWVEGAGVEHAITGGFFYATVSGGVFYIASSAALLNALSPGDHPTFTISGAGDNDSAPRPFFVGRTVTFLGTFQNRLLVGSGGVLAVSKTDDYLNFFRSTVLTLPASDPFEMLPQGSEDDSLLEATLYDQDLVIFGKKRQYTVVGSVTLTPTSANMPVLANYENVADCAPVAAGGFIFYAKRGEKYSSMFQIQPGQTENSPESFPASSQIDSYLVGDATELAVATGSPSLLFMRTSGSRSSLYTFAYLDKPDGRKMDSWSRWDFAPCLGAVIGMSVVTDGVIVFFLRTCSAGGVYVVADFCPTTTGLSQRPYLDSQRHYSQVAAGGSSLTLASAGDWAAAFDNASERRFTGTNLSNVASLLAAYPGQPGLQVGATTESKVTLTNPYMRDGKDKAILSGRLTVTKFIVAFRSTIGMRWSLKYRTEDPVDYEFNGRLLGAPNNVVGVEPISDGQINVPVGRETRQFSLTLRSRRWYPFTVTAIEWVGQFFNRVQRF